MPAAAAITRAVALQSELVPLGLLVLQLLLLLVLSGAAILGVLLLRRQLREAAARPAPVPEPGAAAGLDELRAELAALRQLLEAWPQPAPATDPEQLLAALRAAHAELGEHIEAALERLGETLERERQVAVVPARPVPALSERVTDRLLAMGYERVQIVTDSEHLDEFAAGDGDGHVLVEASRQGVLHKGRVRVRAGVVAGVDVHPTYAIFP